jgi:tripartite-type tricarboxylate transporter receptor subunit TctC
VTEVLSSAEGREALVAQGVEPEPGPPDALTARIRTDMEKWRKVIDQAGIKPER